MDRFLETSRRYLAGAKKGITVAEVKEIKAPLKSDRLITPPVHCGAATILVAQPWADGPPQYALPGRLFTSCRNEARRVAVAMDNIIQEVSKLATEKSTRRRRGV